MNRLLNCDCVKGMQQLNNDSIDLTVTSPPYDNIRLFNTLSEESFQKVAQELYRITKPGGTVCWVVQEQVTANGGQSGTSSKQRLFFHECGFMLGETLIMARY